MDDNESEAEDRGVETLPGRSCDRDACDDGARSGNREETKALSRGDDCKARIPAGRYMLLSLGACMNFYRDVPVETECIWIGKWGNLQSMMIELLAGWICFYIKGVIAMALFKGHVQY